LSLPFGDLGFEPVAFADAAIQTLPAQHADFDLDHVQPTGVLGRVMELQALKDAMRVPFCAAATDAIALAASLKYSQT
jgi:hypothetical protein